jgi:hypothetical protein
LAGSSQGNRPEAKPGVGRAFLDPAGGSRWKSIQQERVLRSAVQDRSFSSPTLPSSSRRAWHGSSIGSPGPTEGRPRPGSPAWSSHFGRKALPASAPSPIHDPHPPILPFPASVHRRILGPNSPIDSPPGKPHIQVTDLIPLTDRRRLQCWTPVLDSSVGLQCWTPKADSNRSRLLNFFGGECWNSQSGW